jgi:hypothetical protein
MISQMMQQVHNASIELCNMKSTLLYVQKFIHVEKFKHKRSSPKYP